MTNQVLKLVNTKDRKFEIQVEVSYENRKLLYNGKNEFQKLRGECECMKFIPFSLKKIYNFYNIFESCSKYLSRH